MAAPLLIVEDSADEAMLLTRALTGAGVSVPLVILQDGDDAIEYLAGRGTFADRLQHPAPQLLLLDLKLPRVSGFGVLQWVRAQPGLRRLPIVVLTSSGEEQDVINAYEMGANSYLVKPSGFRDLQELARKVHEYWINTNVRPSLASP